MDSEWKYYNHALISALPPHESPHLEATKEKGFWKIGGGYPLLARWDTDFDCDIETAWWYVIKDTPFDISSIKSKRRYEINKGKRFYDVREILACDYKEELYEVTVNAYSQWPEKYRPKVEKNIFIKNLNSVNESVMFGGFDRESNKLCGYSILNETNHHVEFSVLRVNPESERNAINAAMVAAIVEKYNDRLGDDFYINDGSRAIRHETAFQDYLEKYFGFRKAYCKLNIKYRFPIGIIVTLLYPVRKRISSDSSLGSKLLGLLKMEEIRRSCR